jgi:hypothetical protein
MARRSNEYEEQVESLRDDLLSILNVNDTPVLQEFACDAYIWAQNNGQVRDNGERGWQKVENATMGEFAGAFKSLTTILGGGGATVWAQEAFSVIYKEWMDAERVTPSQDGKVFVTKEVMTPPPSVWHIAAYIDGYVGSEDLTLRIAKRIHELWKDSQ